MLFSLTEKYTEQTEVHNSQGNLSQDIANREGCKQERYYNTEEGQLWDGHMLRGAHDIIAISNTSHIFHSSVLVIWTHHMINLTEGIPLTEGFLIIILRFLTQFSTDFFQNRNENTTEIEKITKYTSSMDKKKTRFS